LYTELKTLRKELKQREKKATYGIVDTAQVFFIYFILFSSI